MFLKDKADAMHRSGNYRGAVNAYTKALQIDASLTACLSNRAASHLKLKDFRSVMAPECSFWRSINSCISLTATVVDHAKLHVWIPDSATIDTLSEEVTAVSMWTWGICCVHALQ